MKYNICFRIRVLSLALSTAILMSACSGYFPVDPSNETLTASIALTEEQPMPIPKEQGRGEPIEQLVPMYAEEYMSDTRLKDMVVAFRRWEWNKVYSGLDQIVEEDPDYLDAYRLQAEVYLINQDYRAALSQLDRILEREPMDVHALGVTTIIMHIMNDEQGESERLNALKQVQPEAAAAVSQMLAQADQLIHADYSGQSQTDVIPDAIAIYGQTPKSNGTPSAGMLSRLERGLEMAKKFPDAKIILSGGDVRTEYTEASVMKQWLLDQGVSEDRLILDEKARDTYGNAIGTLGILEDMDAHSVIIVGTLLHLPRAVTTTVIYAQHIGYDLAIDSAGGGETAVLDDGEVAYAYVNAARAAGLFTKSDYSTFDPA
ncbi:YdcF family protein [Faecalibacterium sp. An122]|uniref:YdcF family protein n=1 Tax=Faecalibacterium sp. An122 TaxID=1965551 RepID=UPI000B378E23|nr:YdcF family protein [Faecalibacterium sp. An122]OUQ35305.1 hypothetical protein B5E67_12075 [Faecalibacterium sp. An122]